MMRRIILAGLALSIAAMSFRPQIADALVARGDDLLYKNARDRALEHYARALLFDPRSETAADRYVFLAMEEHRQRGIDDALRIADRFLQAHPRDAVLLEDRALCLLVLHDYSRAAQDFRAARASGGGARDARFAVSAAHAAARQKIRSSW